MTTGFASHGGDASPTCPLSTTDDWKTATETARKDRPWFMAVSLGSRPRCFGCGGRMLPKVVRIQENHALCEACSLVGWDEYRPFWAALESLGAPMELTRSRGIVFWTPPPTLPDQDAYIRWLELWDIMRGPDRRPLISKRQKQSPFE